MNIYDYKNKGYATTPTTPLRSSYKSTYLDEEGLSGGATREQLTKKGVNKDDGAKTPGKSQSNHGLKPAIRGRRDMFRIESKLYDNNDVELNANTDLSPIAAVVGSSGSGVPNGRDWSGVENGHNRSVSTTSNNNNGYHSDSRYDGGGSGGVHGYYGRNNNSNHHHHHGIGDYVDNNVTNRNVSITSTNHDTLDRSILSGHMPNGELVGNRGSTANTKGMSSRAAAVPGTTDLSMNNRSILSVRNSTTVDQSILSTTARSEQLNDLNKSSVSQMNDINRSGGVLSRSVLSNRPGTSMMLSYRESGPLNHHERSYMDNTNPDLNKSAASTPRDYDSLTRDAAKSGIIPTHKQNGGFLLSQHHNQQHSQQQHQQHSQHTNPSSGDTTANRSSNLLNLSRGSLLSTRVLAPNSVQSALLNISFVCVLSLILVAIAVQLLFKLSGRQLAAANTRVNGISSTLLSNGSYASTAEVAAAVASVVVMLDLCCLLICSMQAVFAVKLLRCSQGPDRAYKYLKECASTRFIAVSGFFISIPVLLLAILLYVLMEFRLTAAIISVVIMSVGLVFMLLTVLHSAYYWRLEKERADLDLPAYTGSNGALQGSAGAGVDVPNLNELSTLV